MVFNTSAGETKINTFYGYNENEGNEEGKNFSDKIFKSIEMH